MIIMVGIILLLLEGIISNYVSYLPFLFSMKLSLLIIYLLTIPLLLIKQNKKYFWTFFGLGFIYDLFYTNVYFLHSLLFCFTFLFLCYFKKKNLFPPITIFLSFIIYITLDYFLAVVLFQTPLTFYFSYLFQLICSNFIFFIILLVYFLFGFRRKFR